MPARPASETPVPFWERLGEIARYPFRGAALSALVALTVCSLLGLLPGIGLLLGLMVWLAAYKYGFEILRATADGAMESPDSILEVDDGTVMRMLALQVLFIALLVFTRLLGTTAAVLVVLAAIAFLQPGCIMSLAIDGSLARALNPLTPLTILARVGWPYLLVSALMFAIQAGAVLAGGLLADLLPWIIEDLAVNLLWFWGLFATCHLMGYLIWQFRDELGYQPEEQAPPEIANPDRELLDRVDTRRHAGDTAGALAMLREAIGGRAVGLDVHAAYRDLLRDSGDAAALRAHDAPYVHRIMLETGDRKSLDRRALAAWRDALDADPAFVPLDPGHGTRLADAARMNGQHDVALGGLLALVEAHPTHVDAPRWGLDAAQLLVERHARDAEARALLERAQAQCTDQALQARIASMLTLLRATTA